ncbi:uncharacterized protein K452DRAFT_75416 [Aplosporella prunicola CBS 121167]|uniref:Uncharacterized protein n=1 Tax=Aplosporella prunicola CBS 121167 TaxID=1176127 RepID=A0A6A6B7U5_9PEZI|nr:uncharacterized protein K452DRAFT_75416 [Aplosporella prunicola CBS 121167]KAF2139335.1 hypothetical protein K452DRAFT_75416 [Aplosporella prunicola CBS 121167]
MQAESSTKRKVSSSSLYDIIYPFTWSLIVAVCEFFIHTDYHGWREVVPASIKQQAIARFAESSRIPRVYNHLVYFGLHQDALPYLAPTFFSVFLFLLLLYSIMVPSFYGVDTDDVFRYQCVLNHWSMAIAFGTTVRQFMRESEGRLARAASNCYIIRCNTTREFGATGTDNEHLVQDKA